MNNLADKIVIFPEGKKKSGWAWILAGIILLLLVIPFILYGIGRASYNGIVWIKASPTRKNERLQRKNTKLFLNQEITKNKQLYKDLKQAKKSQKKEVENENGN